VGKRSPSDWLFETQKYTGLVWLSCGSLAQKLERWDQLFGSAKLLKKSSQTLVEREFANAT